MFLVYSRHQKIDTSRDAFDHADFETVLKILLSFKKIGS